MKRLVQNVSVKSTEKKYAENASHTFPDSLFLLVLVDILLPHHNSNMVSGQGQCLHWACVYLNVHICVIVCVSVSVCLYEGGGPGLYSLLDHEFEDEVII